MCFNSNAMSIDPGQKKTERRVAERVGGDKRKYEIESRSGTTRPRPGGPINMINGEKYFWLKWISRR